MLLFFRRYTARLLAVSLSAVCGVAFYCLFGPSPKIVVPVAPVDVGAIPRGMSAEREIRLTNEGTATLRIQSVRTDCGCLRAFVDRDFVPAGDSFTVHIEADGVRLAPSIHQTVRIFSNAPGSPHLLTVSHSCVPENLTVYPPQVSFGRIDMNAGSHVRSCQLFSPNDKFVWKITTSSEELVAARLRDLNLLEVSLATVDLCGGIREWIELEDGTTSARLPITASVVGPVFASPSSLVVYENNTGIDAPEAVIKVRSGFEDVVFRGCTVSPQLQGQISATLDSLKNQDDLVLRLRIDSSVSRSMSLGRHWHFVDLEFSFEEHDYRFRLPVEIH